MMKTKVFAIFDQKAGVYHPPFVTHNRAVAMRMMSDVLARGDHSFALHPHDYSLFELGEFDDATAQLDCGSPQHVCVLLELLSKEG